jgi:hypothetical protein
MTQYCLRCNLVVEKHASDRVELRAFVFHQSCFVKYQQEHHAKNPNERYGPPERRQTA